MATVIRTVAIFKLLRADKDPDLLTAALHLRSGFDKPVVWSGFSTSFFTQIGLVCYSAE